MCAYIINCSAAVSKVNTIFLLLSQLFFESYSIDGDISRIFRHAEKREENGFFASVFSAFFRARKKIRAGSRDNVQTVAQ